MLPSWNRRSSAFSPQNARNAAASAAWSAGGPLSTMRLAWSGSTTTPSHMTPFTSGLPFVGCGTSPSSPHWMGPAPVSALATRLPPTPASPHTLMTRTCVARSPSAWPTTATTRSSTTRSQQRSHSASTSAGVAVAPAAALLLPLLLPLPLPLVSLAPATGDGAAGYGTMKMRS